MCPAFSVVCLQVFVAAEFSANFAKFCGSRLNLTVVFSTIIQFCSSSIDFGRGNTVFAWQICKYISYLSCCSAIVDT